MPFHRWAKHIFHDGLGRSFTGTIPISLFRVAAAAAEETLQGSPLATAWLNLFRSQLSVRAPSWLRWRGDLAESAELRRAYSGLYGRFFARTLLQHHLGYTDFLSLGRYGLNIRGSVEVRRSQPGDIPDWIAWCPLSRRHVLAEAKGTLTAKDFHGRSMPSCVREGKKQFGRVEVWNGWSQINPLQWVAATRWATDDRDGEPATALWDPPQDDDPFSPEEASRHQQAMRRAWLSSLAPGFGFRDAQELRKETAAGGLIVFAQPGGMEGEGEPDPPSGETVSLEKNPYLRPSSDGRTETIVTNGDGPAEPSPLRQSPVYERGDLLEPHRGEASMHNGVYTAAVMTKFGVRPVREQKDVEDLLRLQERARSGDEAAIIVGLSVSDKTGIEKAPGWLDAAGLVRRDGLAVFDLTRVEFALRDGPAEG